MPQDLTFLRVGFYIEAMTASETTRFRPRQTTLRSTWPAEPCTRATASVCSCCSADVLGPLVSTAARHGDLTAVRSLGKRIGEDAARSLGQRCPARLARGRAQPRQRHAGAARLGHAVARALGPRAGADAPGRARRSIADRLGLAALLGGMLTSLGGRDVACVPVGGTRFVVVHPSIAETVWGWAKDGSELGQRSDAVWRRRLPDELSPYRQAQGPAGACRAAPRCSRACAPCPAPWQLRCRAGGSSQASDADADDVANDRPATRASLLDRRGTGQAPVPAR